MGTQKWWQATYLTIKSVGTPQLETLEPYDNAVLVSEARIDVPLENV